MPDQIRCAWCSNDALYQDYHDLEWGKEMHDDHALFELLSLEGFQSGLSWITILRKRIHFRTQFENFDYTKLAHWTPTLFEIDSKYNPSKRMPSPS
jgi:DNA-3-methyladenine glycosylase I